MVPLINVAAGIALVAVGAGAAVGVQALRVIVPAFLAVSRSRKRAARLAAKQEAMDKVIDELLSNPVDKDAIRRQFDENFARSK